MLRRNPNAIHIGLTATPRKLEESKQASAEDQEITANNRKYFGEPVYEYTLIEAQEDGGHHHQDQSRRHRQLSSSNTTSWNGMPVAHRVGRIRRHYGKAYGNEPRLRELGMR